MQNKNVFMRTEQIDRIYKAIDTTVSKNGWIAISGDVGSGKSRLLAEKVKTWAQDPQKYIVIPTMSWKRQGSRVASIMKRMIKAIAPDEHVPGDVEYRAERLKTCLMRATRQNRKVILTIDEMQDLSEQSIRELKKVHEITGLGQPHLFSIVMIGKNSENIDAIFNGREIGYRCRRINTSELDNAEVISFAEEVFGLSFPSGKDGKQAKDYFCEMAHHSPLGVQYLTDNILSISTEVTVENIRKALVTDIKQQLKRYGYSMDDVAREAHMSKTAVVEIINMKGRYAQDAVEAVNMATAKLIGQAKVQERASM